MRKKRGFAGVLARATEILTWTTPPVYYIQPRLDGGYIRHCPTYAIIARPAQQDREMRSG